MHARQGSSFCYKAASMQPLQDGMTCPTSHCLTAVPLIFPNIQLTLGLVTLQQHAAQDTPLLINKVINALSLPCGTLCCN